MMRPRRYGIINRSIARSVSYSLRNYNKGKPMSKPIHNNSNTNTEISLSDGILIIFITLLLFVGLAFVFPTFGIISLVIIFFICMFK